jgi:acyl carrier protein
MESIEHKVRRIVARVLGIKIRQILIGDALDNSLTTRSISDLLDNIRWEIEIAFNLDIPIKEATAWKTVGDIVRYVEPQV